MRRNRSYYVKYVIEYSLLQTFKSMFILAVTNLNLKKAGLGTYSIKKDRYKLNFKR